MKVATWNVNSVRARKDRLLAFLGREQPDVLCLQELKVETDAFPYEEVRMAGYHAVAHGQKTYNGVAVLAREQPADVRHGMDDDVGDAEARVIVARVGDIEFASIYVPNGSTPQSEKFAYKLSWLERFSAYLARSFDPGRPLIVAGDLNIAPDDLDVARPSEWSDSVLCVAPVRAAFRNLLAWGLADVVRTHHPDGGLYSWWDYRQLGFPKNNGLRIDHILATEVLHARCTAARVDRNERKGKQPSDHAPVIAEFDY